MFNQREGEGRERVKNLIPFQYLLIWSGIDEKFFLLVKLQILKTFSLYIDFNISVSVIKIFLYFVRQSNFLDENLSEVC